MAATLDRTTFPAFLSAIAAYEASPGPHDPRSYPGYPRVDLPRPARRLWPSLDAALAARRTPASPGRVLPSRRALGRLFGLSHGLTGPGGRGPSPSAGGLAALEIFTAPLVPGWLAGGAYHYDRAGHHLARVSDGADLGGWRDAVPSLAQVDGGALLLVIVGDLARVERKYTRRAERFLLLEAGHAMQCLGLVACSIDLGLVPLGGVFERDVARLLGLPRTDRVLYAAVAG
jgi:SagB-type dehydrogenase family enzyme